MRYRERYERSALYMTIRLNWRIMPDYERRREDLRQQGVGLAW